MSNFQFEEEVCNAMQKSGKCDGMDCELCRHQMKLFETMLKIKLTLISE